MTDQTTNRGYPRVVGTRHFSEDVLVLRAMLDLIDADMQAAFDAIATKTGLLSPAFTGTPTAPTPASGDDSNRLANTAFVKAAIALAIANLVNGAPSTLDALNELAAALGNDPNFATTMATQLGLKANSSDVATLLAAKASLTGAETLTNKTLTTPVLSLKNSAGALPTALAELQWDSTTGRLKVGTGSATKEFAASKIETIFDQDVTSQLFLDFDISAYRKLWLCASVKSTGASDNLCWRYSIDGGSTFVSASVYAVQSDYGQVTTSGSGSALGTGAQLSAGGISNNASIPMGVDALLQRMPGINQILSVSEFGGYGNSTTITGDITAYISSSSIPASAITHIRLFQNNGVAFSGSITLQGLR